MPRRSALPPARNRIDRSPLAVTSSGVFLGLGYTHDLRTAEQAFKLLRTGAIEGTVFVGVAVVGSKGMQGLKQFEAPAADTARGTTGRGGSRSREKALTGPRQFRIFAENLPPQKKIGSSPDLAVAFFGGRGPALRALIDGFSARSPVESVRQLGGHFSVDLDPSGR
jgi:hypothetical protein